MSALPRADVLGSGLLRGAWGAVRGKWRVALAVWLMEAALGLVFVVMASQVLADHFGNRPLFDRAVAGDIPALVDSLRAAPGMLGQLLWAGLALGLVWFAASLVLAGGLLEALRSGPAETYREAAQKFGAGGAQHALRFARLWLWSWLGWIPALVVLAIGIGAGAGDLRLALDASQVIVRLLASALPGVFVIAVCVSARDLARLMMVRDVGLAARKALWRGFKLSFRRPRALAVVAVYFAMWVAVSALYVGVTMGHPMAGAAGAMGLWVVRQVTSAARMGLRVAAYGGQQTIVD